jgi:hypothetical protein
VLTSRFAVIDHDADVRLIIKPLPDEVPAAIGIRRWLKQGLRAFGLKCVSVEEVPNGSPQPPSRYELVAGVLSQTPTRGGHPEEALRLRPMETEMGENIDELELAPNVEGE